MTQQTTNQENEDQNNAKKKQAWLIAVISMLTYMPCAGALTSFPVIVGKFL